MRVRIAPESNFYVDEFACRCGCSRYILHPGFAMALDHLRTAFGKPMHVTSGCRCLAYNNQLGGASKSLHICDKPQHPMQKGTLAVDIAAVDGAYRGTLFALAWGQGWSVGWNAERGFLHLDRRDWVGLKQTSFDY